MNAQQEKQLTHTLMECINYLKKHNIYVSSKFENNFSSLNESVKDTVVGEPVVNSIQPLFENNIYAYLKKVLQVTKNADSSLNESVSDEYNISKFNRYLTKLIGNLEMQNDCKRLDIDSLKRKASLNASIFVKGMDINHIFTDLNKLYPSAVKVMYYDITNSTIIIVYVDNVISVYDINNDTFGPINGFYNFDNLQDISSIDISNIKSTDLDLYMKSKIHNNIVNIYRNLDLLGLKFTDNLYKDNTRGNIKTGSR